MARLSHVLAFFLVLSRTAASLPTCQEIVPSLTPCFSYLKGRGEPTSSCCEGVAGLVAIAGTKPGLQQICQCLKDALIAADYNPNLVPTVSKKCGFPNVSLPPITQKTNCKGNLVPILIRYGYFLLHSSLLNVCFAIMQP